MSEVLNLAESLLEEDNALLLVCDICDNTMGIPTSQIQEILVIPEIRTVHHAPSYVRGLFNLRGKVLALIDPAIKLGLPEQTINAESRILVVEAGKELVGLLVESLTGIFPFSDHDLVANPENLQELFQKAVAGFFFLEGKMIGLLRLERLLDRSEDIEAIAGETK